jgi:glycosyltransferase involved in cell wall biosynthesis
MKLAIVNHLGDVGAGAEHSLLQFLVRLPRNVEPIFFFFEDGRFARSMRERFGSVTIVPMSERIAMAQRDALRLSAIPDGIDLTLRLAKAIRTQQPDLVLTNSMKAHIVGSLSAKLVGLPCINYVHDFVEGQARTLLQIVSFLCADERLTCSNAVSANIGLAPSTAVYAPLDTAAYAKLPDRGLARTALGLPNDGLPVVGLVGRISRWKGQDRFIRIAIDVLRDTDAHFAIVGSPIFGCDPDYVPELTATVARAGLEQRIHFVPWQTDMPTVFGALDLACSCSTREPFGRTSLEALAGGIPVIAFDDAGVCEIFADGQGGTHVTAGDEIAFARAVRMYLRDPALAANAKIAAQVAAQRCDITAHGPRAGRRAAQCATGNLKRHALKRQAAHGQFRHVDDLRLDPNLSAAGRSPAVSGGPRASVASARRGDRRRAR